MRLIHLEPWRREVIETDMDGIVVGGSSMAGSNRIESNRIESNRIESNRIEGKRIGVRCQIAESHGKTDQFNQSINRVQSELGSLLVDQGLDRIL